MDEGESAGMGFVGFDALVVFDGYGDLEIGRIYWEELGLHGVLLGCGSSLATLETGIPRGGLLAAMERR